jgi:hypothetical protein
MHETSLDCHNMGFILGEPPWRRLRVAIADHGDQRLHQYRAFSKVSDHAYSYAQTHLHLV